MLADTKQAEPSRPKAHRTRAIVLAPVWDAGGLFLQVLQQAAFIELWLALLSHLGALSWAVAHPAFSSGHKELPPPQLHPLTALE